MKSFTRCNTSTIPGSSSRTRQCGRNKPMPQSHFELPKKETQPSGSHNHSDFWEEPRIPRMFLRHRKMLSALSLMRLLWFVN